ncbi:VOC family protein [Chloroflexota bacterium]
MNFHLLVEPDSREEVDRYFNMLSAGETVTMPLQETYWGSYYGHCTDKLGIQWRFKVYNQKVKTTHIAGGFELRL